MGPPATELRTTRFTARPAGQVVTDLASLDIPDATVVDRGLSYVVFAPRRSAYGPVSAVLLTILLTLVVLVLTAYVVVVIALLPLAALPLLPLLLDRRPALAVGSVELGPGRSQLTVHGEVWGELAAAVEVYLDNLPKAADEDAAVATVDLAGSAASRVG